MVYPSASKKAWISAYFSKSSQNIGVYFRTKNDLFGDKISEYLESYKEDLIKELEDDVNWQWEGNCQAIVRMNCNDIFDHDNRDIMKAFFKKWLNSFVNTFRPRLKKIDF